MHGLLCSLNQPFINMSYQTFTDQWETFLLKAGQYFNVMANYEFLLFIIGIQESGKGFGNFSKQEKTDLISLGICRILEIKGYMRQSGNDPEGWPLFDTIKNHQVMPPLQHNRMMREGIMQYFETNVFNQS